MLSSSNMAFCCKSIVFCLIPFFFLEIQIRGMKNSRHKNALVYKPRRIYAPRLYVHQKMPVALYKPSAYSEFYGTFIMASFRSYYIRIFSFTTGPAPDLYGYIRYPVRLWFTYGSLRWNWCVLEQWTSSSGWAIPNSYHSNFNF